MRPVALLTYSTKPRGGVVHTLALAEALADLGVDVRVVALGDPAAGFFRPLRAPVVLVPGPAGTPDLETKVAGCIDRLEQVPTDVVTRTPGVVLHAQDCISARAAARVREAADGPVPVVRTVHHVDDFTSRVLQECQRAAILEPDVVLAVTEVWREILAADYGVPAGVVPHGVDVAPLASGAGGRAAELPAAGGAPGPPPLPAGRGGG